MEETLNTPEVKEETAKVSDAHVKGLVAASILDHYVVRPYNDPAVVKKISTDSDYAKFSNECSSIKRSTGNVAELVELCAKYDKAVQVEAVKKKLEDAKNLVIAKYPLIKHCSGADAKDIADDASLDPYAFMRDAYLQRRANLIADGAATAETTNDGFEPADEDVAAEAPAQ